MGNRKLYLRMKMVMMLLAAVFSTVQSVSAWDGSGTESAPYQIKTVDDLNQLSSETGSNNFDGVYFKLMNNLTYTGDANNYTPIGVINSKAFYGHFDGNGKTISGIRINNTDGSYLGIFGFLGLGAEVKDLTIANSDIAGYQYVGGIVGYNWGGTITGCHATNTVTVRAIRYNGAYFGGIVGYNNSNPQYTGLVENCTSAATLANEAGNTRYFGAIGGRNASADMRHNLAIGATIPDAYTSSDQSRTHGAVVGYHSGGVLEYNYYYNCTVAGATTGKGCNNGDVTNNYGAVQAHTLTLYNNFTADFANVFTFEGKDYYPHGVTINLLYNGQEVGNFPFKVLVNGEPIVGSSFVIENDATVSLSPLKMDFALNNSGDTPEDAYVIWVEEQWNLLADRVAAGNNYSGKYFLLANDISVTSMVGTSSSPFKGNFNGGGNTLTVNYDTSEEYTAPFRYTENAVIHHLTVDGTIKTSVKFAAGITGGSKNTTITNCLVNATITSTVKGDGTNGGIVSNIQGGNFIIENCVFAGSLLGSKTDSNGGFAGWTETNNNATLTITNSLFIPEEVTMTGAQTFARSRNLSEVTLTDCYYTQEFGNKQGNKAYKTEEEVAYQGLYLNIQLLGHTLYGWVNVNMSATFNQTGEEIKPEPSIMTESGTLIPQEGNYTLSWSGDGKKAGLYTVTIIPAMGEDAFLRLVGSLTLGYTIISPYTPRDLTASVSENSATVSWTGSSERYIVRYRKAAKVIYFNDCEDEEFDEWTIIDADGDGYCWNYNNREHDGEYSHSGSGYLFSQSYSYYSGLEPDNWLITPKLPLKGMVKVWMKGALESDCEEHVAMYVSLNGKSDVADFTHVVMPETVVTSDYVEYTADLSRFEGQEGYIAIRHFNTYDMYQLLVDDIGLYDTESAEEEWQEIETTETTVAITGLDPYTWYDYQVVGIGDDESYPSVIASFQTKNYSPKVTDISVTPGKTTAQIEWDGYGDHFKVRYAPLVDLGGMTQITLSADEIWSDGSGYQMLLDADATAYGTIIPETGGLTESGDASAETYAAFEYKIPEDADGSLTTSHMVRGDSVTILIPAGTYDWCITNPSVDDRVWIASSFGDVGGRYDNFVFEPNKHYSFRVVYYGTSDGVEMDVSLPIGDWTEVEVEDGAFSTLLSGLTGDTKYVLQIQAIQDYGKSVWSEYNYFTTCVNEQIVLNDNQDNETLISDNENQKADVTLADRTLYKGGKWNTLCLPFDLTDFRGTPLEGATVKTLASSDYNAASKTLTLTFSDVTAIEGGKPYLVMWEEGTKISNPVFHGVTIVKGLKDVTTDFVTFKGLYGPYESGEDSNLFYLGADNQLFYPESTMTICAQRAYFQLTNGVVPFLIGDVNGDNTTSVADVMMMVDHCLDLPSEGFLSDRADVNGDGSISVADVMALVDIILSAAESQKVVIDIVAGDTGIGYGNAGTGPALARENSLWDRE